MEATVKCWSCEGEVPANEAFCPACRKIQPLDPKADLFAVLGVPRSFALDRAELDRRFREASRQLHPDRFARAADRERRLSLERSTRLNDAYRTLKDDRARAEYLLRLHGHDPLAEGRTLHDPEFLAEQMEVREALAEARAAGDDAGARRIAEEAKAQLAALFATLRSLFVEAEQGRAAALAEASKLVARARYYDNIVAEVEGGEGARSGAHA